MATNSLYSLNNANISQEIKFTAILEFIKSFNKITEQNKNVIYTRTRDVPFLDNLDLMLNDKDWLDKAKGEEIGMCQKFRDDYKFLAEDDISLTKEPNYQSFTGLSNNELRKRTCQRFSTLEIPKSWFDVTDIQIWPLIIVRSNAFKRKRELSIPQQMKLHLEEILGNVATNVGEVTEIEPGFDSLKIKSDCIASRTRLLKFLESKLPDWSFKIPPLRDPIIRIHNVKINPADDTLLNDWLSKLISRNEWGDQASTKIVYCYKRNNYSDILLSISPATREKIERRFGRVNLGYAMVKATDFFDIKICRRCCGYGHLTSKCQLITKCGYCSSSHYGSCPAENDSSKQRCPNCFKTGTNAFDKTCQVFRIKLKHELEKVNFNYKLIMN